MHETISLNVPTEKVYTRVTDPERWKGFVPGLVRVGDFSSPELRPGTGFSWEWGVAGAATISGGGQITQHVPNAIFALQVEGKLSFTAQCTFTPTTTGTDLSVMVDYRSSRETLGNGFVSTVIHSVKSGILHAILMKIKGVCEG